MQKRINKEISKIARKAAIKAASYYANVACPFITYQPKMSDEVKKLRKF